MVHIASPIRSAGGRSAPIKLACDVQSCLRNCSTAYAERRTRCSISGTLSGRRRGNKPSNSPLTMYPAVTRRTSEP
jgi:hypothetical protein